MPRASAVRGRKEKDLSEWETYADKLISAIFVHVSKGGYVGVAHGYGYGIRLYVSYEDERETFEYDDPTHLDLVGEELHEWRREVLDRRRERGGSKSTPKGRNATPGAGGPKTEQSSF